MVAISRPARAKTIPERTTVLDGDIVVGRLRQQQCRPGGSREFIRSTVSISRVEKMVLLRIQIYLIARFWVHMVFGRDVKDAILAPDREKNES